MRQAKCASRHRLSNIKPISLPTGRNETRNERGAGGITTNCLAGDEGADRGCVQGLRTALTSPRGEATPAMYGYLEDTQELVDHIDSTLLYFRYHTGPCLSGTRHFLASSESVAACPPGSRPSKEVQKQVQRCSLRGHANFTFHHCTFASLHQNQNQVQRCRNRCRDA